VVSIAPSGQVTFWRSPLKKVFSENEVQGERDLFAFSPRWGEKIKMLPLSSRRQQSTGLARDLSRIIFPIRFVGEIIDRPHCTTGFAGGE